MYLCIMCSLILKGQLSEPASTQAALGISHKMVVEKAEIPGITFRAAWRGNTADNGRLPDSLDPDPTLVAIHLAQN